MNATNQKSAENALSITPLQEAEVATVSALAHRIWPVAYDEILSPAQLDNLLTTIYSHDNLHREIAHGHRFWLAHWDTAAVGFVSGYQEAARLWLRKLYVLPDHQGRGIGQALLATLCAAFPAAREVRLFVNRENVAAQRFYTHAGFLPVEEVNVQMGDYHFIDLVFSKALA